MYDIGLLSSSSGHNNGGGSVPKSCITIDELLASTTDSILPLQ